jgi:ABC-2 type transport system ATP-binding protein
MSIDRTEVVLRTDELTYRYGDHVVLDRLNLSIHRGEIFGYVGANGAGKTTTFRILSGILDPSDGKAFVLGQDVTRNKRLIKQKVGYLPDNFGVYPTLQVWEYMDFFAAAYNIPPRDRAARIDYCLEIANANEFRDKLMGGLSRGMKQRVGIAKTLLHDPAVLIFDEPSATIDPWARIEMRRLLRNMAALGKSILVSSHIVPELADLCDNIGFLSAGKLIACGPVKDILRSVSQTRTLEIQVQGSVGDAAKLLVDAPGEWTLTGKDPNQGLLRYDVRADADQLAGALDRLVRGGMRVFSFTEIAPDLQDVLTTLR